VKKIVKNSFNFVTTQFTVFNHTQTLYEVIFASLEPMKIIDPSGIVENPVPHSKVY
jgi:hypothetical protein